MDRFWQDFRYGMHLLFKNPGLTAVAVISLALGIGANTTIFTLVNALFLRPLPVSDPEQLVAVYTSDFSGPPHGGSSYPDYVDFKNRTDLFSGLLSSASQPLSLGYGEETGRVFGEIVTGN